ncbi:hypothetical protein PTSG_10265 [Salpingoeca rosetta]|uniref:Uncharacterized protein n=1 Tax=Salpingoeca rosetta (strain ATCC 50818 / BSB-021) TaxID=946362 RepID=F2UQT0_SALR5|nr:uncharacterized protein PTSG_10265 [Salpingoeca rosetta]EGD79985.1 hypothetical protein PTSG_10265 [Salpingoeca rosetta]|eukprot:XP_004988606.1 hypothetical protein PTSG_10265 [Salpingoeca rosetta]
MATNGDNGGQGVSVVADDDDTKHNTSKTMLERFNLDSPSAAKEEGSSGARSSSAQLRRQRMIDQLKAEPAFQQRQHQQQHRKLERRSTELMLTESIAYRASLERLRRSVKNAPTVQPLDGHGGGGGGGDGVNGWWPRGGDLASGLQVTWLQPQINAQWDEYFRERQQELLRDGLASREATRTITMDDG